MKKNLLIIHGGGPTAVLNASLYGAVRIAKNNKQVNRVLGAKYGTAGILNGGDFIDLSLLEESVLELLLTTPGSAIGTSRTSLSEANYVEMAEVCYRHDIGYVLFSGGNGTMDACAKLGDACQEIMEKRNYSYKINVAGIPKTVDNDLAMTDHAPGFGSAAKYIATTVAEIGIDVRSLPIHVSIVEVMGRNSGWLTAATALARTEYQQAPHLIYLPEQEFDEEQFLADVQRCHQKHGGLVVAVSEGIRSKGGKPVVPPIFETDRSIYFGDVSAYLAELVVKKLGIKARSEKPGLAGRTSISLQSSVDRMEAVLAGEKAASAVIAGQSHVMSGFVRKDSTEYGVETVLFPLDQVRLIEKTLPLKYINADGNDVTKEFCDWCRPLIGAPIPEMINLTDQ